MPKIFFRPQRCGNGYETKEYHIVTVNNNVLHLTRRQQHERTD